MTWNTNFFDPQFRSMHLLAAALVLLGSVSAQDTFHCPDGWFWHEGHGGRGHCYFLHGTVEQDEWRNPLCQPWWLDCRDPSPGGQLLDQGDASRPLRPIQKRLPQGTPAFSCLS